MSRAVSILFFLVAACGGGVPPAQEPPAAPAERSLGDADAQLEERIRGVVVHERPRLRACYEEGLARDAGLEGRVILVLEIGQDGKATHVYEARREGLGEAEVKCFARVLRAAHFHDGAARAVKIQVPLAFAKADAS